MASWAVKECRYKYMPKSGSSDVQATPILGYLKRKQPNLYAFIWFFEKRNIQTSTPNPSGKRKKYRDVIYIFSF